MRIAVSADDAQGIDSVVSPHFGRCPYFILVDVEDREVTEISAIENPFYGSHQPGQVPGFIREQGAEVMLTGGMGARAVSFFRQFGIEPVTGASATVRISLEQYLGGDLRGAEACKTSQEHGHGDVPPEGAYEQDDLGRLKEEIEALRKQLDGAVDRLGKVIKRG